MRRPGLLTALLLITAQQGAMAEEWPVFRGPGSDNAYRGETPLGAAEGLGLEVVWKRSLGSGYSSVSVAAGRAVTAFSDGTDDVAVALDAATGEEIWRYPLGPTNRGHNGAHDGPISTPLIDAGRVFVLGPLGHFHAIDLGTGEKVWSAQMVDDHGVMKPLYGFGSSPILIDGAVIVEAGAYGGPFMVPGGPPPGSGPSVVAFDPATGELLWQVGHDTVNYQSAVPATVGGRRLALVSTDVHLYGLEAKTGETVWKLAHDGKFYPGPGVGSMNPVAVGDSRFFLSDSPDSSTVVALAADETGKMGLNRVWSGNSIRGSYAVPVFHEGHLYAYSSRFLTCVDAATGESVWRSRQPGDGFPILVDGHLVVMTKKGSLHVAPASPEGYSEVASLKLFEEISWTPPSFADGRVYVRSLGAVAAVGFREKVAATTAESEVEGTTRFARFLAEVEAAADKVSVVDLFLASVESFPLIEIRPRGEEAVVHFLYRGIAEDMAIAGDILGDRSEEPMTRVTGTDLFYYSNRLLRDARVSYHFTKDFEERITDPRNPRRFADLQGEVSWVGMPGWQAPTHLEEAPAERRGKVESLEIAGHQVEVYLPAGYDPAPERRYPVVYVHGGRAAMGLGGWTRTLDNLVGRSVEPLIAVFLYANDPGEEFVFRQRDAYAAAFAEEVVPAIDEKYRTLATVESRGSAGAGLAGYAALYSAFKHPGVVGRVASQSAFLLTMQAMWLVQAVETADEQPLAVFLEWGTYDKRSDYEAWDFRVESRKLGELLKSRGYEVTTTEAHDGDGWASWRNRNDKVLEWLFPSDR